MAIHSKLIRVHESIRIQTHEGVTIDDNSSQSQDSEREVQTASTFRSRGKEGSD